MNQPLLYFSRLWQSGAKQQCWGFEFGSHWHWITSCVWVHCLANPKKQCLMRYRSGVLHEPHQKTIDQLDSDDTNNQIHWPFTQQRKKQWWSFYYRTCFCDASMASVSKKRNRAGTDPTSPSLKTQARRPRLINMTREFIFCPRLCLFEPLNAPGSTAKVNFFLS